MKNNTYHHRYLHLYLNETLMNDVAAEAKNPSLTPLTFVTQQTKPPIPSKERPASPNSHKNGILQPLHPEPDGQAPAPPPYLDNNSFLSQTLDDFFLQDKPLSPERNSNKSPLASGGEGQSRLAREEAKLEKEIPNLGQSVFIGDHNVCISYHEEPGSDYRVWEWHSYMMLFDEEDGFCPEYVYGNYLERVPLSTGSKEGVGDGGKDEVGKEKKDAHPGLRGLIGDDEMGSAGNVGQRILHRNLLCRGLGK